MLTTTPFNILGAGPRGGRVKRALPSWMPPLQKVRSDQLSQDIIEAIHAAARRHCPTSPCMKDECRRRLGKGHWESARAMFRHDTWNEYWAWFCEDSPALLGAQRGALGASLSDGVQQCQRRGALADGRGTWLRRGACLTCGTNGRCFCFL